MGDQREREECSKGRTHRGGANRCLRFAILLVVLVSTVVGVALFLLSQNLPLSFIAGLVFGLMLLNLAFVYLAPPEREIDSTEEDVGER